jgi:hypothetical protein
MAEQISVSVSVKAIGRDLPAGGGDSAIMQLGATFEVIAAQHKLHAVAPTMR